jgi:hypothetical protein
MFYLSLTCGGRFYMILQKDEYKYSEYSGYSLKNMFDRGRTSAERRDWQPKQTGFSEC